MIHILGVMPIHISLTALLICTVLNASVAFAEQDESWKSDWTLDDFFKISIDTDGYHFPTSIAFVPNPGSDPQDPLYFVTELRGKLKVVTNDRTVHTFAEDFFKLKPERELPSIMGEVGMAGLCLEPENGYVFVTFTYRDENGILRNNLVRFETEPTVFSLKPHSMTDFTHIFSADQSTVAHQIGPCQISDKLLYVSVGDGAQFLKSQQLDSTLGKILRMTLEGKPSEQNPFYTEDGQDTTRDYVWAYGLRNPFSMKIVQSRVFIADNGFDVDRFLEVHEGENYLWDGTDWSISTNSSMVFAPSVAPVQMDYFPEWLDIFPDKYRGRFYLALAGETGLAGPSKNGGKSIIMLDYAFDKNRINAPPEYFLRYRGKTLQLIVGLAIGPDGLYFTPLYPDARGQSAVLKVQYDAANSHPYKIREDTSKHVLLSDNGCLGCHSLSGEQGAKVGPALGRAQLTKRLDRRLNSPEYISSAEELDDLDIEPYKSFKSARDEVLNAKGDERIRLWVKYHLIEPKFDNPNSQMPNMGLTENEARILTDILLSDEKVDLKENYFQILTSYIPELRYRHVVYALLLGFISSLLFFTVLYLLFLRRR